MDLNHVAMTEARGWRLQPGRRKEGGRHPHPISLHEMRRTRVSRQGAGFAAVSSWEMRAWDGDGGQRIVKRLSAFLVRRDPVRAVTGSRGLSRAGTRCAASFKQRLYEALFSR
ncbi:hypothetical protein APED_09595 [Acanthopleuribacter pedis]